MFGKRTACSTLLLLPLLLATASARECEKVIVSADPTYPPLSWYDGQVFRGASIDIIETLLKRLGIPYEFRYVGPFARVLRTAEIGEVDVITTLKNTPERRVFLAFPSTALYVNPISVFVRRGEPFHYTGWKDLIGKKGGIARDNKFGGGFDEFLESHLTIEVAHQLDENFAKLSAGRIDYFITGLYTGLAYLAQNGLEAKFSALSPAVTETWNYFAFSKASPCIKYLKKFDEQLAILVRRGKVQTFLDESLNQFRAKTVR